MAIDWLGKYDMYIFFGLSLLFYKNLQFQWQSVRSSKYCFFRKVKKNSSIKKILKDKASLIFSFFFFTWVWIVYSFRQICSLWNYLPSETESFLVLFFLLAIGGDEVTQSISQSGTKWWLWEVDYTRNNILKRIQIQFKTERTIKT